ncbi:MAG TPA: hypothetical protein VMA95_07115 [Streptosporangiaceae bacterium]|nr:hypothetical protein [Streptosporangiaceae bacterium]
MTRTPLTPPELLDAAREMLAGAPARGLGERSRIAAFLARQALERRLTELWSSRQETAGLGRSSGRSQLICLRTYLNGDVELAQEIRYAWVALSNACHYHAYDLTPTTAELSDLINTVARFVARPSRRP